MVQVPLDIAISAAIARAARAGTLGPLPARGFSRIVLVGHSLGGRAALLAGEHPSVRTVVALNPWVYPTDGADLRGRDVLVGHGQESASGYIRSVTS